MRRRSGFTLIEMMIVLAIIAALAAILTPLGVNALNRAKATQHIADIRNIRSAAELYHFDKNDVPTTWTQLNNYLNADELSVDKGNYTLAASPTGSATGTTEKKHSIIITPLELSNNVLEQIKLAAPTNWASVTTAGTTTSFSFYFNF